MAQRHQALAGRLRRRCRAIAPNFPGSRRIRVDFTPDPEQQAVADVVTSVLDRDNSWDALVAGGVTALAVPERLGGDGLGLSEVTTALTENRKQRPLNPRHGSHVLGTPRRPEPASPWE